MSNRSAFGTPGFEGKRTYIKDQKLKSPDERKGESVTHLVGRIVPPMKSLQKDPDGWAQFTKYHYGHKGAGRKPGSTFSRTFACPEQMDFKTKEILVECPKCSEVRIHKAEEERLEGQVKAAGGKGKNPQFDQQLQAEKDWLFNNSLSMGYKMYIVTPSEEIIRLQISGKAKKALTAFLKDQKDSKGVNALDIDNGVYIDFMRTGFGRDTQDTFAVATKTIEVAGVGKVPVPMPAPLSDELLDRLVDQCTDLTKTETVLSIEQIQMLVDSDGSPEETDRIFALGTGNIVLAGGPAVDEQEEERSSPPTTNVKSEGQTGGITAGTVNLPPKTEAALPAGISPELLAMLQANPALLSQLTALQTPATPPSSSLGKTDDEFFSQWEKK